MRLVVIGAEGCGTQALCEWSTRVKTSEAGTDPVAHREGEEMEIPVQGLAHTLQMQVVEATPERVMMTMPVTAQHLQPWGYLHGGASIALAETAATVGAFLNCPAGMVAFGQEINANHIRSVREGMLTATALPLHIGRTSQIWEIDIHNEQQKRICVSRCTLAVIPSDSPGETK